MTTYRNSRAIQALFYGCGLAGMMWTAPTIAAEQVIEEVVVTAERREESLQDVSVSVSAFNEETLKLGGIDDVSRLELLVPGLNYAFAGNDAKFNVRGANSSNTFGDNSSIVGAFVDGVYQARSSQQARAFFDVSNVEFLRGPQGTLYGRNTFAGALNVYTHRPDTEEFDAEVKLSWQRFDRTRSEAVVNLPLADTFAIRIAGFFDKSSGFISNDSGPDVGAQNDFGYRVSALWQPTERLEILGRYSNIKEAGNEAGLFGYTFLCRNEDPSGLTDAFGSVRNCENPVRGSGGRGTASNGPGGDPWKISQDYVRPVELEDSTLSLEVVADLGAVSIKSITSLNNYNNDINFDFDFSPTPNQRGGYLEESEGWSQELQVSSTGDGAFKWTAGFYYSQLEDFSSFYAYNKTARDDTTRGKVVSPDGARDKVVEIGDMIPAVLAVPPVAAVAPAAEVPAVPATSTSFGIPAVPAKPGVPAKPAVLAAPARVATAADVNAGTAAMITLKEPTDITSEATALNGFFANAVQIDTDYFGVYAQGEFSFTDKFRLIAGLRYNEEEKSASCGGSNFTGDTNKDGTTDRVVNVVDGAAGSSLVILPDNAIDIFTYNCSASDVITSANTINSGGSTSFDNITWRAGVEFDVVEDVMLYVTGASGYLSGSASTTTTTDEQESQVIELGFRSIFLNHTLQLNGAFHITEYSNLLTQRQRVDATTGIALTFSDNGGDIEAFGLELDAIWLPAENLTVTGTLAYLNSEFGTFGQENPYQLYRGKVQAFIDQAGETTPWSPEVTFSASVAYRFDLGGKGSLTPYIQHYYSDGYNTSNLLATDPAQDQDAYSKTDARLIWESTDLRYSFELFIENIQNSDVLARGNNNSDDIVQTSYLYPRNFGLKIRARL